MNRGGNRPSYERASERLDQAIELCRGSGFKKVTLRGDTDFTQTKHLDRWDEQEVEFVFGMDARKNVVEIAETLSTQAWNRLERRPKYEVETVPRQRPENVKQEIVREREYKNIRTVSEDVAEFELPGPSLLQILEKVLGRLSWIQLKLQTELRPDVRERVLASEVTMASARLSKDCFEKNRSRVRF